MQNKKMERNDRTVDSDEIIHEKLIMCFKKKIRKDRTKLTDLETIEKLSN